MSRGDVHKERRGKADVARELSDTERLAKKEGGPVQEKEKEKHEKRAAPGCRPGDLPPATVNCTYCWILGRRLASLPYLIP